jgi:hypothetical protein
MCKSTVEWRNSASHKQQRTDTRWCSRCENWQKIETCHHHYYCHKSESSTSRVIIHVWHFGTKRCGLFRSVRKISKSDYKLRHMYLSVYLHLSRCFFLNPIHQNLKRVSNPDCVLWYPCSERRMCNYPYVFYRIKWGNIPRAFSVSAWFVLYKGKSYPKDVEIVLVFCTVQSSVRYKGRIVSLNLSVILFDFSVVTVNVRGGADKSLVRPGRKQATATKLGIYST